MPFIKVLNAIKRFTSKTPLGLLVFTLIGCVAVDASATNQYKGFKRADSLISAEQLNMALNNKDVEVKLLALQSKAQFLTGHIPGAMRINLSDFITTNKPTESLYSWLVDKSQFEAFAQSKGIDNQSLVVVYDTDFDSTMLWWAFFLYGKNDVKVLDGGIGKWKNSGFKVNYIASSKPIKKGNFKAEIIDSAQFDLKKLNPEKAQFWDVTLGSQTLHTKDNEVWEYIKQQMKKLDWKQFRNPITGEVVDEQSVKKILSKYHIDEKKKQVFISANQVGATQAFFTFYLYGFPVSNLLLLNGLAPTMSYLKYPSYS